MIMVAGEITSGLTGGSEEPFESPRSRLEESVEEMRQRAVEDLQAFLDGALKQQPGEAKALRR